jgi:hypothetical protein
LISAAPSASFPALNFSSITLLNFLSFLLINHTLIYINAAPFNATAYAATLKSTYPTLCARVNVTLLSDPLTNPEGCRRPLKLGEVCWSSCRATLRGVGQSCYAVGIAKNAADPTIVGSNSTVAYNQCIKGLPYTSAADYEADAAAAQPPASSPPAESATPAASAAWKPSVAVFAAVPLVASLFAPMII